MEEFLKFVKEIKEKLSSLKWRLNVCRLQESSNELQRVMLSKSLN